MNKRIVLNNMVKIIFTFLLFFYITTIKITPDTSIIDGIIVLILSFHLLIKSRNNIFIFLFAFLLLYCNYSIVVAEYIVPRLGAPLYEVKTTEIYGLAIRIMLVFTYILAVFYKESILDVKSYRLIPKKNNLLYWLFVIMLIYIMIFEVSRGRTERYSVHFTSVYGYAPLLFMYAYYFSDVSNKKKNFILILAGIFIFQDFYYGGRTTSLQLMLLIALTYFPEKLNYLNVTIGALFGIVFFYLVQSYRIYYNIDHVDVKSTLDTLFNQYFVFDTPIGAYYASATHLAGSKIAPLSMKLTSFFTFIFSIFVGTKANVYLSDPTHLVRYYYDLRNLGGGMLPTHFYFWLDWFGVILIAVIIVFTINQIFKQKSDLMKLVTLAFIFRVPGWYMYSPTMLFRSGIFFTVLLYLFSVGVEKYTQIVFENIRYNKQL